MTKILVTSDFHLTEKPEDEYRWEVFNTIRNRTKQANYNYLVFLGDLTEEKDRHSAYLVKRITQSFSTLGQHFDRIFLLKGNHDYVNPSVPFFKFLELSKKFRYISTTESFNFSNARALFVPHGRPINGQQYNLVFFHNIIKGTKLENSFIYSEKTRDPTLGECNFSGDAHVPQTVRGIEYVGAPHTIIFSENYFSPRLIEIEIKDKKIRWKSIPIQSPIQKITIHIEKVEELLPWIDVLNPLDRVKVILETTDATKSSILTKKIQEISANNWNLQSSCVIYQTEDIKNMKEKAQKHQTPKQLLKEYCREKNITEKLLILGEKLVGKADETKDINTSEL